MRFLFLVSRLRLFINRVDSAPKSNEIIVMVMVMGMVVVVMGMVMVMWS